MSLIDFQHKRIENASSQELLYELIRRHGHGEAPKQVDRHVPFANTLVEVDKDHTAEITMPEEDLELLEHLLRHPKPQTPEDKVNTFLQRE